MISNYINVYFFFLTNKHTNGFGLTPLLIHRENDQKDWEACDSVMRQVKLTVASRSLQLIS